MIIRVFAVGGWRECYWNGLLGVRNRCNQSVLTDKKGNVLGGDGYRFVSVKSQATGCEYGDFGGVSIRDIATYTKDDSYATSSYGSIITDDNVVVLVLNVYVDAGNLKSVAEETFAPAE